MPENDKPQAPSAGASSSPAAAPTLSPKAAAAAGRAAAFTPPVSAEELERLAGATDPKARATAGVNERSQEEVRLWQQFHGITRRLSEIHS